MWFNELYDASCPEEFEMLLSLNADSKQKRYDIITRVSISSNLSDRLNHKVFAIATGDGFTYYDQKLDRIARPSEFFGSIVFWRGRKKYSLKNSPDVIHGSFDISNCQFTSLEGAPKVVDHVFDCSSTDIVDLVGAPEYANAFSCRNCLNLISLKGGPKQVNSFIIDQCKKLISLDGLPEKFFWSDYQDAPVISTYCCYDLQDISAIPADFNGKLILPLDECVGTPIRLSKTFKSARPDMMIYGSYELI